MVFRIIQHRPNFVKKAGIPPKSGDVDQDVISAQYQKRFSGERSPMQLQTRSREREAGSARRQTQEPQWTAVNPGPQPGLPGRVRFVVSRLSGSCPVHCGGFPW